MPPSKKKRGQAARGPPAAGGGHALLEAALDGDTEAVARLLAAGRADPNASMTQRMPSGEAVQATALCVAAAKGHLEVARLLLDSGADPSHADGDGETPLMLAAGAGELEVLRLLLGRGAAVDAVAPDDGATAFHCACFTNNAECAEWLVRVGCDVGLKDQDGLTGREIADAKGHVTVVERLRAVVSEQLRAAQAARPAPASEPPAVLVGDGGLAAQLVTAAGEGNGAAVARLLAAGADPNASVPARTTPSGAFQTTALITAVGYSWLEVARLLLDAGADPSVTDGDGVTPLMQAAVHGQLEALRLLLARGAAADTVSPGTGFTSFHMACFTNHAECAEVLARAGCDVGIKDKKGMTGREVAEGRGHAAVVARLRAVVGEQLRAAQAAPEPAAVVGDGRPAAQLVTAARDGDAAAVSRLLVAGADPNASVSVRLLSGEVVHSTALVAAAARGRLEVARLLLEGGADPGHADGEGGTPLMLAAGGGELELVRLLLGRGAAVDAAEPDTGATAFHCACRHNQAECVEALARAGCDFGLKTKDGQTGRQWAESTGSKEVVRRLHSLARQPFVGVLVELVGLVGAAEHNGKRATVRVLARPCHCVLRVSCSNSLLHSEKLVCAAVAWGSREVTAPSPAVLGAALPAGEAALHARAARAAGRGRWRGEAHGRAAGELCAGASAGRHTVRPGQEAPMAPAAAVQYSSRVLQPALTAASSMNHAESCSLGRAGSR
jgi:ankyrin repeat protein